MVLRIAGLPVWVGPTDMIAGARAVLGWTDEAVDLLAGLPERVVGLLDEVDALIGRVGRIAGHVEGLVGQADGIVGSVRDVIGRIDPLLAEVQGVAGGAAALVARADRIADGAGALVSRAGTVADGAAELVTTAGAVTDRADAVVDLAKGAADGAGSLLATYQPIAEKAAPLARKFVDEFSEEEVEAAIHLVDQLPELTRHLVKDVMPILVTLDRVGPDVHELLNQLEEIRHAINGIPGFRLLRRRGEEKDNGD